VGGLLAVVMEEPLLDTSTWEGVVGAKLGSAMYVDLTGDVDSKKWAHGVKQLVRLVKPRLEALLDDDDVSSSRFSAPSPFNPKLARIPPEVGALPEFVLERKDVYAALKTKVLHESHTLVTSSRLPHPVAYKPSTVATGLGGVGKTTLALSIVNDTDIRAKFEKICWVSLGHEPNIPILQGILYRQLTGQTMPDEGLRDVHIASELLQTAANSVTTLLVLDDVWDAKHLAPLNFLSDRQATSRSALLVTSRMRSILPKAAEVECGTLSNESSLKLLLELGGQGHLLDNPPAAALEAVELCKKLPLALGVAGGLISELPDTWEDDLIPLLREMAQGTDGVSVHQMVDAALAILPDNVRLSIEHLFILFAVFPEDAIVNVQTVDVLAPILPGMREKDTHSVRLHVRQAAKHLVRINLLRGSVGSGLQVHDLVRECMIERAEKVGAFQGEGGELLEGGLVALQRRVLDTLLQTASADVNAIKWCSPFLRWHMKQATSPGKAHKDELAMRALTHADSTIRCEAASGMGFEVIYAEAKECVEMGERMAAAQLMYALMGTTHPMTGRVAKEAWEVLQSMEETAKTRELETAVLSSLLVMLNSEHAMGSPQFQRYVQRLEQLSQLQHDASSGMEPLIAAFVKGFLDFMGKEGIAAYITEPTVETVDTSLTIVESLHSTLVSISGCSSLKTEKALCLSYRNMISTFMPRHHTAARFDPDALLGVRGAVLLEALALYDFSAMNTTLKSMVFQTNWFMSGVPGLSLLLFWGDLSGLQTAYAQALRSHQAVLKMCLDNSDSAERYSYESYCSLGCICEALLLVDDRCRLGTLLNESLLGQAAKDEKTLQAISKIFEGPFGTWRTESGYRHGSMQSLSYVLRGLVALAEPNTEESRAALVKWLPAPVELTRIAVYDCAFRGHSFGSSHPSLICARLYGEILGYWDTTLQVINSVLQVESHNALLRTEAYRLAGTAYDMIGNRKAAYNAAQNALKEAARARYAWLEMLAIREMLRYCDAQDSVSIRSQLAAVDERISATKQEVQACLGDLDDP